MLDPKAKREKFKSLAESRTNKALEAIGRLANLSNRSLYEWEEEDVRRILRVLRSEVAEVESRFSSPRSKASPKFKL